MYAVVDIETSGSNTTYDRVIEIAIFVTDGEKVIDSFHSLVNAGVEIPYWITGLTGIENEDLDNAPSFAEIFDQVEKILEGNIFVAHNVNFDFGFIKAEFEREGKPLDLKKLCTVRLARKVLPGYPSYSLGSICSNLGIKIEKRHRADGDAEATVELLHRIIAADSDGEIAKALKKSSKEQILPPNLSKEIFESLPETTGIYFFHNENGKVIYVGKAENIKKRIRGHFTSGSTSKQNQSLFNNIFDISFEECGEDIIALIREIEEIRKLWPEHNKESKRPSANYGIYLYEDQNGLLRVSSGKLSREKKPALIVSSALRARVIIKEKLEKYQLCERLCNLRKDTCVSCSGQCLQSNVAAYNDAVLKAFSGEENNKVILIKGKGRKEDESSFVLIRNESLEGFGYVPYDLNVSGSEDLEPYIKRVKDNPDIHRVLSGYIKKARKTNVFLLNSQEGIKSSYGYDPSSVF